VGYLPTDNAFAKRIQRGIKNDETKEKENSKEDDSARESIPEGNCARFTCKPKNAFAKHFVK
jgi:hypothetical protein